MRNYNNYYSAPPLVGGYGGYGYGGGGISIFPSFGVSPFYGGGIFNFFIVMVCNSYLVAYPRSAYQLLHGAQLISLSQAVESMFVLDKCVLGVLDFHNLRCGTHVSSPLMRTIQA